jgi:hypothetical protein
MYLFWPYPSIVVRRVFPTYFNIYTRDNIMYLFWPYPSIVVRRVFPTYFNIYTHNRMHSIKKNKM